MYTMDTSKQKLEMFYQPWQVKIITFLEETYPDTVSSLTVWKHVNITTTISRASIINFLNKLADNKILTYTEQSGKGGYHRLYKLNYIGTDLNTHIAEHYINKLLKEFPKETRNTIQNLT